MKLKYKNIFSVPVVIIIVMAICIASFGANKYLKKTYAENFEIENEFAGEEGYGELQQTEDELYNYRVNKTDDSAILICYNGAMVDQATEVIVPETLDGHLLTVIDELAFSWNEYIEKLVLPDSVVELRNGIVSDCPNIKSIECSGDIDTVDEYTLDGFHGTVYTNEKNALWKHAKEQNVTVEKLEN